MARVGRHGRGLRGCFVLWRHESWASYLIRALLRNCRNPGCTSNRICTSRASVIYTSWSGSGGREEEGESRIPSRSGQRAKHEAVILARLMGWEVCVLVWLREEKSQAWGLAAPIPPLGKEDRC